MLGLGRAKARPEIWPAGHGFWVARPDPGQILGGPTQPELYFGWPEWPEVSDITWDIAHAWQALIRKKYVLVPT